MASIDGPTDGDQAVIAVGLIVVTEEQLATGVGAISDSAADLDAEWLWHGFLLLQAQAANLEHGVVDRLTIDSKAMRRFKQTQSLAFVVSATSLSGTPATDVIIAVRQLFGE